MISISKESGQLAPVAQRYREYLQAAKQVDELKEMSVNVSDAEMAELAQVELPEADAHANGLLEQLKIKVWVFCY